MKSEPGAVGRLISNSRWNATAFCVSLLANFLTIPLVIAGIGLPAFGSAGLVLAAYAPLSLVGTVLGQAAVRSMAAPAARGDAGATSRAFWSAATWVGVGCAGVALLAAIAGPTTLRFLSSGDAEPRDWVHALWIAYAAWSLQQVCLLLQGALAALQAYARLALANAVGAALAAVCVVGASRVSPDDLGFLAGTAIGFGVLLLCLLIAMRGEAPWLLRPSRGRLIESAEMLSFARWQGASHFAGSAANQVDRYVLGVVAPLSVVGQYNVAMRLQEVVHMGLLKGVEVLLPHFSVTASDRPNERADFYMRACWVVNLVSVAALAPLIPTATPLITLWVDRAAAEGGATMLRTLAVAGVLGSGINVFTYLALATDQARRLAYLNFAHSLVLVGLTIPLIFALGPVAAGAAYVVGNLLRLIVAETLVRRHFGTAIRPAALRCATWPPLLGGLSVAWILDHFLESIDGWMHLAATYLASAVIILLCALLASAAFGDGRALFRSLIVR